MAYLYTIVGRDPYLRGKLPTTTQVPIFPVILTFSRDNSFFDPTSPTDCSHGHAIDEAMLNSPLFQSTPTEFDSNGVMVGATQ